MTSPTSFAEFAQVNTDILALKGEIQGVVNSIASWQKKIAALADLMERALDQAESVTRQAGKLATAAQAALAARTAEKDAALAELAELRAQGRAALRDPAKP